MHTAVWLVVLVVTAVAVATGCRRLGLPAPVVLVAVGAVASYLPGVPDVRLTAELVLAGLLPPLLYNAALQTSLIDFKANRGPILLLSVGLVAFTTAGVAVVVHAVLPEAGWPAAFALGAVVAPPDAVAATAIARRIGLPRRLVTILEGESLLNDATAIVALNTAVLAAAGAATLGGVAVDFVIAAVGGVACGVLLYVVVATVRRHITDPVVDSSVSFVTPFAAYVVAEEVHASGVLAVVVAGLLLGHRAPVLQTARSRISERLNWRTVAFVLENAVFLLIGLQTEWIVDEVADSASGPGRIAAVCAAVLVAVVALRLVWVFPVRVLLLHRGVPRDERPPLTETAVVGWAGMRGVVTLAAAFAIPEGAGEREVLVLAALVVVAGTLLLQGSTLPWVVRRLRVAGPDPREDALLRAELLQEASGAARRRLADLDRADGDLPDPVHDVLRSRLEQRDFAAWERLGSGAADEELPSHRYARLRLSMLEAERRHVLDLRDAGRFPHDIVDEVLTTLDVEESMLDRAVARTALDGGGAPMVRRADACEHLESAPPGGEVEDRRCEDCVREGSTWVHLRLCLDCGHMGCCDSSPRRHATGHHRASGHPVVASAEAGESWRWCFVDEVLG